MPLSKVYNIFFGKYMVSLSQLFNNFYTNSVKHYCF